jgi:carbamoyltransferase
MKRVLGVTADRAHPAAALVVDGVVVAAVREDQLNRSMLGEALPTRACQAVLEEGGLAARDLDLVVVSERPLRRFERELAGHLWAFPHGASAFARSMFGWLGERLWLRARLAHTLEIPPGRVRFVEHARAHAAAGAACLPPDRSHAALIVDDVGEWATTTLARVDAGRVTLLEEQRFPHSLGLALAACAEHLGFAPDGDEAALERFAVHGIAGDLGALAAFFGLGDDGAIALGAQHVSSRRIQRRVLESVLGVARDPGRPPTPSDRGAANAAATVVAALTEATLAAARRLHDLAPLPSLVIGGTLARMPRLVAALLERGPFATVHTPPWPGDDGAALGAALIASPSAACAAPFLGTWSSDGHVPPEHIDVAREAARLVRDGALVGWVAGRPAFGDHSCGGRVALTDPGAPGARQRLLHALQRSSDHGVTWLALDEENARVHLVGYDRIEAAARYGTVALQPSAELARRAPEALEPGGRVRALVVPPSSPSGLDRVVAAARELGLVGLLVTDLARAGSRPPRLEVDALDECQRSGLDALVTTRGIHVLGSSTLETARCHEPAAV